MEEQIPAGSLETLRRLRAQLDAWQARVGEAQARAELAKLVLRTEAETVARHLRPDATDYALDLDRGTMTINQAGADDVHVSR